jgi:hypothetical protein
MVSDESSAPMPGAHVAGWSAWVVSVLLARHLDRYLPAMTPQQRTELARTRAGVDAAAKLFQERGTTASGSAETPLAEIGAGLERSRWMTVADAAPLLGSSERRVRQLAAPWEPQGLARKVGRSWLVDREALEMYAQGRRNVA